MKEKIFITGVTSFIGSDLASALLKKGYNMCGLSRWVSDRTLKIEGVEIEYADICYIDDLRRILGVLKPDIVIHLAAQTPVEYSFSHEEEVFDVNFNGTRMVAKAAKEVLPNLAKFIFASSVEVYGEQLHFPIAETQKFSPASPYGLAKACSELYLNTLHRGCHFPSITFRSTNTYGRSKCFHFIIEKIIFHILTKKEFVPLGDPSPIRDYLFIDDEVDAYVKMVESNDSVNTFGETFNTGTGFGVSVRDLFDGIQTLIVETYGPEYEKTLSQWFAKPRRPYEIPKLVIDFSKLQKTIGWTPKVELMDGLRKTILNMKEMLDVGV